MSSELLVIGGGLAGCEAAWQAANRGVKVTLYEMRNNTKTTQAHQTDKLCELVCSNSFRNDDINSAIGLLHHEMRLCNSLIIKAAENNKVPAGSALAVDRDGFSQEVQNAIYNHENITVQREEITNIPQDKKVIIATGPLTSEALTKEIIKLTGIEQLAFFDAIAPIIYKDSIDFSICWMQSRYDKAGPGGDGKDYVNCPMNKEQYINFVEELLKAPKTEFKDWEKDTPYFSGCLPIEVMAERGKDTLLYGPMKPVGLTNPHKDEKPYAVVQLRQDNKIGTLYNIVGFQTKLKYGEQTRIFRMIPGLENAEFARLGGIHRNTFIQSPKLLDEALRLKSNSNIRFAGQVTGVEGYVESAAIGLLTGMFSAYELNNTEYPLPPAETAMGALLRHLTENANPETFQPMNINFGLMPELNLSKKAKKADRKILHSQRGQKAAQEWVNSLPK